MCLLRLKISKRRHQFGLIRVAILFLLFGLLYLYWCHRTLLTGDAPADYLRDYRTSQQTNDHQTDQRTGNPDASRSANPRQIDHVNEQIFDRNLDRSDDALRRRDPEKELERDQENDSAGGLPEQDPENEKALERQHLLSEAAANDDRSFAKLDFNAYAGTVEHAKFNNKEIKERKTKIQNNDHRTSSVSFSSTANSLRSKSDRSNTSQSRIVNSLPFASIDTYRSSNVLNSSSAPLGAFKPKHTVFPPTDPPMHQPLPAHMISEPIIDSIADPLKNYSFLGKANYPVSKSNRSSSVSSIFPVERRTSSILEKQLAWYELIGITMFNLLGSSLAGHPGLANKKFKNQTILTILNSPLNSSSNANEIETVLSRPISSSAFSQPEEGHEVEHDQSERQPTERYPFERYQNERHQAERPDHRNGSEYAAANNQTLGLMKNLKQSLPQCIIIGVRKAGTRAVLEYLTLNDRIRKADNEVHFFDNDAAYARGLEYYRNQMPYTTAGQIGIEKSPAYFVTARVPERIRTMNASIKLILIVRDPVTRLISDYTQLTHNKLLKLDDSMRASGSNRQQQKENHLSEFLLSSGSSSEFPVDKKAKIRFEPTNELAAVRGEPRRPATTTNNLAKKIEKRPDDENSIIEKSHLTTDYYWNRIGSEPDYHKAEQLDEIEQDADAFVSLAKRQKRLAERPGQTPRTASEMNKLLSRRPKSRPIDFKWNSDSKIIDSNARSNGDRRSAYRKTKRKIDRQDVADRAVDKAVDREQRERSNANRISRQALEQNAEPNVEHQQTDDEDEAYRAYREHSPDDEDVELDDHLDDDYLSSEKQQIKQAPTNRDGGQVRRPPAAAYNSHNSPTGASWPPQSIERTAKSNQDDHYHRRIPKFEELVIRNGEVNSNYKPIKTSIYSLYMDNWLRVSRNRFFSFPFFVGNLSSGA